MKRHRWSQLLTATLTIGLLAGTASPATAASISSTSTSTSADIEIPSSLIDVAQAATWSTSMWDKQLNDLLAAGVTEIVLNGAVKQSASGPVAYYPTGLSGVTTASSAADAPVVDMLLDGARQRGMTVWLGTYLPDKSWFTPNVLTIADNKTMTATVLQDLDSHYASYSDVVAGWYLSSEVSGAFGWSWSVGTALIDYYETLTNVASTASTATITMVSPYYNVSSLPNPDLWTSLWTRILRAAPIDVIALQDGTGDCSDNVCGPWKTIDATIDELVTKYTATQSAITAAGTGTDLWANMDLYDSFGFSRPIGDLASFHSALEPLVSGLTSWSYSRQYAPWTLGINSYSKPFIAWNHGNALSTTPPSAPANVVSTSASPSGVTVTWSVAIPATGNAIAHYRISAPDGKVLSQRTSLNWSGTAQCVSVQAVDTNGNVSARIPTC